MNNKSFDYRRIAEGYAKDRPFLHEHVIDRLKEKKQILQKYESGLDIGCGAGLSTRALRMICHRVIGTDISEHMIMAASALYDDAGYTFLQCSAEETRAEMESIDVVTAAGVINWVDEKKFLPAIQKVLKPEGLLLIYDFWISDQMIGCEEYTRWWHEQYLKEFPKPPRKENIWTDEDVEPYGLHIEEQETYTMTWETDRQQFIRFMLLQSNVAAQVEGKNRNPEEVRAWFEEGLSAFWKEERKELIFEGYSWYLRR